MPLGPLLLFGNDQPTTPAGASVLTFYFSDPIVAGGNAGTLTQTQPAAATSATGWTVGTTAAGNFSRQTYNVEVPTTNFTATSQPSGAPVNLGEDCWRTGLLKGQFSLGTWYSAVSVIAVTSGGAQDGRARLRLWRSPNQDGTGGTEITQAVGTLVGTTITNLSTTVAQSSSISKSIPSFPVANEYLFLQVAWETVGAGGAASDDVLARMGPVSGFADGSFLATSRFSSTVPMTGSGGGYYLRRRLYEAMLAMDEV